MGLSGKYDFRGIKKMGAAGLRSALASTPQLAWSLAGGRLTDLVLEFATNWLANKGLMLLNFGAIEVTGEIDQKNFDAAMDAAINEITKRGGRDALTPAQKKVIDDEVIRAARKFIVIGSGKPSGVSDIPRI